MWPGNGLLATRCRLSARPLTSSLVSLEVDLASMGLGFSEAASWQREDRCGLAGTGWGRPE